MKLKNLSIMTTVLFIISLFVHSSENRRGTDLLAGSDYVKGLDVNKIQKITLTFKGDKKLILNRDSNQFVLENYKAYPADTAKVNDLIYKIASIQVKEKISSNVEEDELKRFELDKNHRKYLVEIFDNDNKKTVSFSVGKSHKGKGNYLYRASKNDIYVSQENLWLNSSYKDFIDTVLLDIEKEEVEKVSFKTNKPLEVSATSKNFENYLSGLKDLRFESFLTATEPKAQGLKFNKKIEIKLKNKLVYNLNLAREKGEHFVKVFASLDEVPGQFVVNKNDGKEELQKIEDVIRAQGDAQKTNRQKGAWVYKVDKEIYNKLLKDSKYFL